MHPSAFVFSKTLADFIQGRTGRFFWTKGVEFSAWPMSAVLAKRIVYTDAPLTQLGKAYQVAQKLEKGTLRSGFWASGDDFGFTDILGCAEFLGARVIRTQHLPQYPGALTTAASTPRQAEGVNNITSV